VRPWKALIDQLSAIKSSTTRDHDLKNGLSLERVPSAFADLLVANLNRMGRFFVIDVHNRHLDKIARNCYAYLKKANKVDTNEEIQVRTCELKWAGSLIPNLLIPPGGVRSFDAFWVPPDEPDRLHFQVLTDSGLHIPVIKGKGTYELEYEVIAEGFPVARCSASVSLDGVTVPTTLTVR
jgi:hypothetical protein